MNLSVGELQALLAQEKMDGRNAETPVVIYSRDPKTFKVQVLRVKSIGFGVWNSSNRQTHPGLTTLSIELEKPDAVELPGDSQGHRGA